MGLRVVVGSDLVGFAYKEALKADLEADDRVDEVIDVGVAAGEGTHYPHIGAAVGRVIAQGKADRGLVVCGTGTGVAIAANKIPGIRASVAHDPYSVEGIVTSNNAQVIAFGARVIGLELARRLAREWLGYSFDPQSEIAEAVAVFDEYDTGAFRPAAVQ